MSNLSSGNYTGVSLNIFFSPCQLSWNITANSEQGVEVDVYGFQNNGEKACDLDLDAGLIEVGALDAVAAVPKHNTALRGIQKIPLQLFLESGNKSGASTTF